MHAWFVHHPTHLFPVCRSFSRISYCLSLHCFGDEWYPRIIKADTFHSSLSHESAEDKNMQTVCLHHFHMRQIVFMSLSLSLLVSPNHLLPCGSWCSLNTFAHPSTLKLDETDIFFNRYTSSPWRTYFFIFLLRFGCIDDVHVDRGITRTFYKIQACFWRRHNSPRTITLFLQMYSASSLDLI